MTQEEARKRANGIIAKCLASNKLVQETLAEAIIELVNEVTGQSNGD